MSQRKSIEEVATAYDQWARTYEEVENATRDLAAQVLRQVPLDLREGDVLEIGCGTGVNTRYLAEQSKTVLALDFSAGMLEQARANISAGNVSFVQCDIQREWPLEGDKVDFVLCTLVLEHIEDIEHVFHEAARVLRPGGEFFVCELHPFRQRQGCQARFTREGSEDLVFVRAFLHDVSDYVNAIIHQGFEFIRMEEWRHPKDDTLSAPRILSLHVRVPQPSSNS